MADTLETFFSRSLVRRLASDLARVHPPFPARRFVAAAARGLDDQSTGAGDYFADAIERAELLIAETPSRFAERDLASGRTDGGRDTIDRPR